MKYFCLFEGTWKDAEKVREAWKKVIDDRVKGTDMFPKTVLFEPHVFTVGISKTKDVQGFTIVDTENPEHLANYMTHYADIMDWKIIPIVESSKLMNW